jgi:hypothetical protein
MSFDVDFIQVIFNPAGENMRSLLTLILFISFAPAFAALTVTDKEKLATVTLHTELINASKRVYLAADFEANHKKGLIACEIKVEHRNGNEKGPLYTLVEDTTLLPNEKIPFNLGLFPERFHASGLDVKANLTCKELTFFDKPKPKTVKKTMLKAGEPKHGYCCRMSPIALICATEPSGGIDVNATEFRSSEIQENEYSPCYPPNPDSDI